MLVAVTSGGSMLTRINAGITSIDTSVTLANTTIESLPGIEQS
jgi:hypothetical protein